MQISTVFVIFYLVEKYNLLFTEDFLAFSYCYLFASFYSWVWNGSLLMLYCYLLFIEDLLLFICRFPQLDEVLPGGEGWFIVVYLWFIVVYCRFPQLNEVLPGGEGWFIEVYCCLLKVYCCLFMVYCCFCAGFHSSVRFYLE